MSEYQYVAFRAIDGPVSEKNLVFMRQQSSRAEVTPWSFDNEYHFDDFHGNTLKMLRRGYDFHLRYSNFGNRKLMIRLPSGLPDAKLAKPYFEKDSFHFIKDPHGPGGVLYIEPYFEPDELDDLDDLTGLLTRLLPLRAEIIDGDLRPLYLAHLAIASDANHDPDEETDAPVPAGLEKLTSAQRALAELCGMSKATISAAAKSSLPLPDRAHPDQDMETWLQRQPEATKTTWLCQLLANPPATARNEILAEYQKTYAAPSWPTTASNRTVSEIAQAAEIIQAETDRKQAETAGRNRAKKLADLAADPAQTLRETEDLVRQRNTTAYNQVALLLSDLRDALSGTDQAGLPEEYARKLKNEHPTRRHLTTALRSKGFVRK